MFAKRIKKDGTSVIHPMIKIKGILTCHLLNKKVVTAQGGRHYLYGWLIILAVQILLEVIYLHERFTPLKIWEVFVDEVMADIFSFSRFVGSNHTSWIIWALISFTSLSYTLWVAKISPIARRKLFKQDKFVRIAEEDSRKK